MFGEVFQIVMSKKRKMYIINRKFKFFSLNTGYIFILWCENYYILLLDTATHEIFSFIPLDENKSYIFRKKTWMLVYLREFDTFLFSVCTVIEHLRTLLYHSIEKQELWKFLFHICLYVARSHNFRQDTP
jgi:hypothetical protein